MWWLKLRMWLLVAILFSIIYAVMVMIGAYLGIGNYYFYLGISIVMMAVQYMLGPKLVEWTMRVKYLKREDNPSLFQMVESLAMRAQIPMPRVAVAEIPIPNAFAFGRSIKDGRVCVTRGITQLLDERELKAVLGHELSHLKNRDVLTITILSVIPMILYRIAWATYYQRRGNDRSSGNVALIGLAAFIFYFITNLLVLYASRIREYFADQGSVLLGNQPSTLASALYKLVYGSARADKEDIRAADGLRAFFVNDPAQAFNEIRELRQLDLDKDGVIDVSELDVLRRKSIRLNFGDRIMECLSTHPNMLKRIKRLSEYKA
jgi:heat shock protein HtpX